MAISVETMAGSMGSPSSAVVAGERRRRRRRRGGGAMTLRRGDAAARGGAVRCAGGSLAEQYWTLRIRPGATESEVKKAFRKLALQYHPDICETVMDSLRQAEEEEEEEEDRVRWRLEEWHKEGGYADEPLRGMCDPTWDLWEEWMGWEGAGIRDYSSHINPYI